MNTQDSSTFYVTDATGALLDTHLPFPKRSGKVRDVYDLGDRLLIVSTDRISAFDYILPTGIPDKGRLLTAMSEFWFEELDVEHHLLGSQVPQEVSRAIEGSIEPLQGRVMVTNKAQVIPFECVVRGYLEGSGLKEYQSSGEICGNKLPTGLRQCDRLPEPIFTPATKAEEGHDENVSIGRMIDDLGSTLALELRQRSLDLYRRACEIAAPKGILIADTKFEFGRVDEKILLIDEVLTPDSSRFWDAPSYSPGQAQPSFDKQFVREWLSTSPWDKASDPPPLPEDIVMKTRQKYIEAFQRITGRSFDQ